MGQREIDNMLLSMIQKHFPALPLSDEYTDWGKWLGFARAAYEAGRASPASASVTAPDYRIADRGFRWDAETRQHIPQLLIEFTPVPENAPNASSGWKDRDKLAAMLVAAPTPPVSEDRWLPIETAPKDEFVLLAGPSGYTTIETVFSTGRMCSDYHVGRWIDHANDDLTDWGFEPTHWMPLPKAPTMQEDKKP